jgi:hypothetical protein
MKKLLILLLILFCSASAVTNVNVLVVGGGGAGGLNGQRNDDYGAGGGGAGGYQNNSAYTVTAGTYPITVGLGGNSFRADSCGNDGSNSTFGTITAYGGGGGAGGVYGGSVVGRNGGSGGGGKAAGAGGTGSQGGNGFHGFSVLPYGGGGGGGASGNATTANGSNGILISISGTAAYYAGGGGGGQSYPAGNGIGGLGGGGAGNVGLADATSGTPNTGGGGGGGIHGQLPGSGGSGIVIVRYKTSDFSTCTGGDTTKTVADSTIKIFTQNGTFTVTPGGVVLTAIAGSHGSVSPTTVTGSTTSLFLDTATADSAYKFTYWSSRASHVKFTDSLNRFLACSLLTVSDTTDAHFSHVATYNMRLIAGDGGTITNSGNNSVDSAQTRHLSATPNLYYSMQKWTKKTSTTIFSDSSIINPTVILKSNDTLTANFTIPAYCSLYVATTTGGTVSTSQKIHGGYYDSTTIVSTPSLGYRFLNWTRSGINLGWTDSTTASNKSWISNISNATATAHYSRVQYVLTMAAGAGGTVLPTTGSVDSGAVTNITANPNLYYGFDRWTRSATTAVFSPDSATNPSGIALSANATITGNFTRLAAVKPVLSKPDSNSTSASLAVTFSWGAQAADSAYIFDISTTAAYTPSASVKTDTLTGASISKTLLDSTTYWWRVKGGSAGSGWSAYSNSWKVATLFKAATATGQAGPYKNVNFNNSAFKNKAFKNSSFR